MTHKRLLSWVAAGAVALAASMSAAAAQDKVKVGVFPISSSLPYFVAIEKGYFKENNIEPETIRLMGGPPNVAALMTNQIDVSAFLWLRLLPTVDTTGGTPSGVNDTASMKFDYNRG